MAGGTVDDTTFTASNTWNFRSSLDVLVGGAGYVPATIQAGPQWTLPFTASSEATDATIPTAIANPAIWNFSGTLTPIVGPSSYVPASIVPSVQWNALTAAKSASTDNTIPAASFVPNVWNFISVGTVTRFSWNEPETYTSFLAMSNNLNTPYQVFPIVAGELVTTRQTIIAGSGSATGALINPTGNKILVNFSDSIRRRGDSWIGVPAGTGLATASGNMARSTDGTRLILTNASGSYAAQLTPYGQSYSAIAAGAAGSVNAMSNDGQYVAIARQSFSLLTVYSWVSGTPPSLTAMSMANNTSSFTFTGLAFSPDSQYLAVTCSSGNTDTGLFLFKLTGGTWDRVNIGTPAGTYTCVSWSPDGELLTAGTTNTERVIVYHRVGDTFTRQAGPTITTAAVSSVLWMKSNDMMFLTHTNLPTITKVTRDGVNLNESAVYTIPNYSANLSTAAAVYPAGLYGL